MGNRGLKNLANKMFFKDKMTTGQISKSLNITQESVIKMINRGFFSKKDSNFNTEDGLLKLKKITKVVCSDFGIDEELVTMKTRIMECLEPRQFIHYAGYELTNLSNAIIAYEVGKQTHGTVNNSRSSVEAIMESNSRKRKSYVDLFEKCKKEINYE